MRTLAVVEDNSRMLEGTSAVGENVNDRMFSGSNVKSYHKQRFLMNREL